MGASWRFVFGAQLREEKLHHFALDRVNGATGSNGYSGGGSGGSIWIESNLIRGYGKIQVLSLASLSTSNNNAVVLRDRSVVRPGEG